MFRFAIWEDKESLIRLWVSCFGDSRDFVFHFLNSFMSNDNIYVCEKDGKIVSAVYALDCSINGRNGIYFYAVATDENYRRQGLAGEEIRFLIDYKTEKGAEFFLLTPSNEKNREYYSKLGFSDFFYCRKKAYHLLEKKVPVTWAPRADKIIEIRERIFGKDRIVSFPINHIQFAMKFADWSFARLKDGRVVSYAILSGRNIVELCCEEEDELFVSAILRYLGEKKTEVYVPIDENVPDDSCKIPRGMIYCSNKDLTENLSENTFLSLNLE